MTEPATESDGVQDIIGLTSDIVSAYVGHNAISPTDLPLLIAVVHDSILDLSRQGSAQPQAPERSKPAVPVKKSVTHDYLICLEDGKRFKSLKRHLRAHYNLTPDEYRAKWGLPADYPMVAPSYSHQRSLLAVKAGLGRKSV